MSEYLDIDRLPPNRKKALKKKKIKCPNCKNTFNLLRKSCPGCGVKVSLKIVKE